MTLFSVLTEFPPEYRREVFQGQAKFNPDTSPELEGHVPDLQARASAYGAPGQGCDCQYCVRLRHFAGSGFLTSPTRQPRRRLSSSPVSLPFNTLAVASGRNGTARDDEYTDGPPLRRSLRLMEAVPRRWSAAVTHSARWGAWGMLGMSRMWPCFSHPTRPSTLREPSWSSTAGSRSIAWSQGDRGDVLRCFPVMSSAIQRMPPPSPRGRHLTIPDGVQGVHGPKSSSQRTPRWREPDSSRRYRGNQGWHSATHF